MVPSASFHPTDPCKGQQYPLDGSVAGVTIIGPARPHVNHTPLPPKRQSRQASAARGACLVSDSMTAQDFLNSSVPSMGGQARFCVRHVSRQYHLSLSSWHLKQALQ